MTETLAAAPLHTPTTHDDCILGKSTGLPLETHLDDAAGIAALLVDEWLPAHTIKTVADQLGVTRDEVKDLVCFLAAVHDVGKVTSFYQDLFRGGTARGATGAEKVVRNHTTVGEYAALRNGVGAGWASAVGSHHGWSVPTAALHSRAAGIVGPYRHFAGTPTQLGIQDGILTRAIKQHQPRLDTAPNAATLTAITGVVILADWIASNTDWTPTTTERSTPERVRRAFEAAQLPARWTPADPWPWNHPERPAQTAFRDLANPDNPAGLYLLEAPMGVGKTKAALALAADLTDLHDLGGVVFALPTRASANGIYPVMKQWARSDTAAVGLVHGTAHRHPDIEPSLTDALLDRRRLTPLKPLTVVTVDQVIAAGLGVKWQMLRHLALSAKVVIVDEVHSYDAFMNTFLDETLRWLAAYRVPVILLSATLPPSRRRELVAAYTGHQPVGLPSGYPTVLRATPGQAEVVGASLPAVGGGGVRYGLRTVHPDRVIDSIPDTGNVLIIRNTVNRAVDTYLEAKMRHGRDGVMLLHSRYTTRDRARLEQNLVARFGPDAGPGRPERMIVVATQVVEQSLDIDFDHLITDTAPAELVLQRAGRVARHTHTQRPHNWEPTVTLLDANPADRWDCAPYHQWTIAQTQTILRGRTILTLPADIAPIVEEAYETDHHLALGALWRRDGDASAAAAGVNKLNLSPDDTRLGFDKQPDTDGDVFVSVREGEPGIEAWLGGDTIPLPRTWTKHLTQDTDKRWIMPEHLYSHELGAHEPETDQPPPGLR